VPVYAWLLTRDVEAIGFNLRTLSLSGDVEVRFDETNPAHFDLFNIRYLLLPSDRQPPVDADFVAAAGRHRLWAVRTSGFLQAVDVAGTISADRRDLGQRVDPFLRSSLPGDGQLPAIEFDGRDAGPSTVVPGVHRAAPGRVTSQYADPEDGRFGGQVHMDREGAVVLKATYHPRWHAEVDGRPVDTEMLAPSFVGLRVPKGTHTVSFRYQRFSAYPLLLLIGLVALVALAVVPRVGRRGGSPHQKGQPTS
jgi:hypothetical protein